VKLAKNASDTSVIFFKAYGGESMKKLSVSEWHTWFKESWENIKDDGDNIYHIL
jgi:hypothetical protein